MTTVSQPVEPTPPPGGTPDQWIGKQRDVHQIVGHVSTSPDLLKCPAVTVVAEQYLDGRIGCIDVLVDVDSMHSAMGAAQARELAGLIVQGADLADQWAGAITGLTPVELLANAFSALRVAHGALELVDGNAGDYVKAALDSISDAAEVLR